MFLSVNAIFYEHLPFPYNTGLGIQNICTNITICGNILEYHQNFTTNNSSQLYSFIRLLESNSRPDCPQLESLELSRRYQSKLHDITRAHSPNRQPVACFSLPQVADGYLKREHGDSANGLPKVISTQSAALLMFIVQPKSVEPVLGRSHRRNSPQLSAAASAAASGAA